MAPRYASTLYLCLWVGTLPMATQQIFQLFSAFLQQNPNLVQQVGAGKMRRSQKMTRILDLKSQQVNITKLPCPLRNLRRTVPQLHHKPVNQLSVQLQVLKPVSHPYGALQNTCPQVEEATLQSWSSEWVFSSLHALTHVFSSHFSWLT